MYYNLVQLHSIAPHAIDAVDYGLSQNILKGDPYNIFLSDIDTCQHLVEKDIIYDELGSFVRTHSTHIFNLQRNASILQKYRDEDTIRFSFMTYDFIPSQMLATLRAKRCFSVEAISLECDEDSQKVKATFYVNGVSSRRIDVTNKWKVSNPDSDRTRLSIPSNPRHWFPDGLSLPSYFGEELLHRWFRSNSCTLITSDPIEELISVIIYLRYAEQLSAAEIAEYTGIDLDSIEEVINETSLTSSTEREMASV